MQDVPSAFALFAGDFCVTETPSVLQDPAREPAKRSALPDDTPPPQASLDAVPVALLAFRLRGAQLCLVSANAAARQRQGLRAALSPGVSAVKVFVQLAGTLVVEQLESVARTGEALTCRHVLREQGRLVLAWKIHAHCTGLGSILVTVQDISELEQLRYTLTDTEAVLHDTRRELQEQTEVFGTMESMARTGYWRRIRDEGESVLL